MASLVFTESYEKREKKFLKEHPELRGRYAKTLRLLELDPSHPSLRLHRLKGRFSELYSVSINRSYRIVMYFIIRKDQIIPVSVGKHEQVY